jgi:tRNA A-37 threonylcarbamoyl transferase component Bud32
MAELTTIGRYDILGEIGRGAMGIVYKARDPKMDRIVAVKTIQGMALAGPQAQEYRDRFTREARAAGRLSHPGIVAVYDVGDHEGTPYLVMEYVEGRTLESALNAGERFIFDRIEELGEQLASALGYAHRNGVVHRDIKPANILLAKPDAQTPERAKVTDLGIAKLTASQITTTGQMLGTPSYMPPEQFTGAPVDGRADIFSLGVILYWMATGDKPFAGDTITAVSYKIVHTDTIPPRKLNPAVPEGLEIIIMRCLEKDPARRYQTGEALANDLATLRAGGTITVAPPVHAAASSEATTLGVGDPNMTLQARATSRPAPMPAVSGTAVTQVVTPATQPPPGTAATAARPAAKKPNLVLAGAGIGVLALIMIGLVVFRHRVQPTEPVAQAPVAAPPAASSAAPPQADANSSAANADSGSSAGTPQSSSAEAVPGAPPTQTPSQQSAAKGLDAGATPGKTASGTRTSKSPTSKPQLAQKNPAGATTTANSGAAKNEPPKTDSAPAKSSGTSSAAPQPSNPPPVTTSPQPNSPSKAPALNPNEAARLKIDFGRVPDNVGFIVLVDGKPTYQRADAASSAGISDEPLVPPGQHEIRVLAATGGVKLGASNSVRGDFEAKKRKTLRVELRDGATGKTMGKTAKVTDGSADFVISFKTGLF